MEPYRIPPAMSPDKYKTYKATAPLRTHWRRATCEEAGCKAFLNGFRTFADESTDDGKRMAHYIRHDKTRKHTESRAEDGRTVFTFPPGQTCFQSKAHKTKIGRPENFLVVPGDWRAQTGPVRVHTKSEFWVEDMQTTLEAQRKQIEGS